MCRPHRRRRPRGVWLTPRLQPAPQTAGQCFQPCSNHPWFWMCVWGSCAFSSTVTTVRACTSAPRSSRAFTTSGARFSTAHISAVWSLRVPIAFGSAPCSKSNSATRALPARAAAMSGVSPWRSARFGSAPASSNSSVTAALPFSPAAHSGVAPRSLARSTSAPAPISSATLSGRSRWLAHSSAVEPSPLVAFTSAPCSTSVRSAASSPFLAASTSGGSPAAERASALGALGASPAAARASASARGSVIRSPLPSTGVACVPGPSTDRPLPPAR